MIKAQLNIAATEAVRLNTNNTAHTVDVDVTTLTDKQRHELANNTKFEDGVFIFRSYTHPITADVLPWSQSSVVKLLDISITKREIEASKRADKISKDLEIALALADEEFVDQTCSYTWPPRSKLHITRRSRKSPRIRRQAGRDQIHV